MKNLYFNKWKKWKSWGAEQGLRAAALQGTWIQLSVLTPSCLQLFVTPAQGCQMSSSNLCSYLITFKKKIDKRGARILIYLIYFILLDSQNFTLVVYSKFCWETKKISNKPMIVINLHYRPLWYPVKSKSKSFCIECSSCNPSIKKTEAGGLQIPGQSGFIMVPDWRNILLNYIMIQW